MDVNRQRLVVVADRHGPVAVVEVVNPDWGGSRLGGAGAEYAYDLIVTPLERADWVILNAGEVLLNVPHEPSLGGAPE